MTYQCLHSLISAGSAKSQQRSIHEVALEMTEQKSDPTGVQAFSLCPEDESASS